VDVESMSRPDERELFKDFMEDFNTGRGWEATVGKMHRGSQGVG
jgi:hypothetical protein